MKAHAFDHFAGLGEKARPVHSAAGFGKFLRRLAAWIKVSGERRHLGRLSPHMLRDIGLHEGDADLEAQRPFWDLPAGRKDLI